MFLIISLTLKLNPFDTQKVNESDEEAVRTQGEGDVERGRTGARKREKRAMRREKMGRREGGRKRRE